MKIVAVLGSPRLRGNSAYIADHFLEAAKNLGAETQRFALNTLTYRGCQACRACKKSSEACIIQDDLTEVLEAAREADVLVLAMPVYFADISGQMKLFIDRAYSFLPPDFHIHPEHSRLAKGKKAVLILTQGLAEELFDDIYARYSWAMNIIGIHEVHLIRGCNLAKPDDAQKRDDILKQAEELAVQIAGTRNKPSAPPAP